MKEKIIQEIDAIVEVLTKAPRTANVQILIGEIYSILSSQYAEEIQNTYKKLVDLLNKNRLSPAKAEEIMIDELNESFMGKAKDSVREWTDTVYRQGLEEIGGQAGIRTSYTAMDKRVVDLLNKQNIFFIGKYHTEQNAPIIKQQIKEIFTEGATKEQIAKNLAQILDDGSRRALNYWQGYVEHTADRVRNMGEVSAYEQGKMEYAQVVATLDDRTTDICREMNGRLIPVGVMSEVRDEILAIEIEGRSTEEVKSDLEKVAPFWDDRTTKDRIAGRSTQDIVSHNKNLSLPPYHYRCRTRTVAYFEEKAGKITNIEIGKKVSRLTKKYVKNLSVIELQNKVQPILDNKKLKYNAAAITQDQKYIERFGDTEDKFIKKANDIKNNPKHVAARACDFPDSDHAPDFQLHFFEKAGEVVVGGNSEIVAFFPGNGEKMFGDKKDIMVILEGLEK